MLFPIKLQFFFHHSAEFQWNKQRRKLSPLKSSLTEVSRELLALVKTDPLYFPVLGTLALPNFSSSVQHEAQTRQRALPALLAIDHIAPIPTKTFSTQSIN